MTRRSLGWAAGWLVGLGWLAEVGDAGAFTFRVSDERELERALLRVRPGGTVQLDAGTYRTTLRFTRSGTAESPIVVEAAGGAEVVIDAAGRSAALDANGQTHVTVRGLTFRDADNGPQAEQAMVRPGSGWTLEDCVFEGAAGAGLGVARVSDVLIDRCVVRDNGQIGMGVSNSERVVVRDTELSGNNPGFAEEAALKRVSAKERVQHEGRWFVNPAWEAGGVKISSCTHVVFERVRAHGNHGPGLWADYGNRHVSFIDCHAHGNLNVKGGWEGIGVFVEYHAEGPIDVTGCRVEANEGAGIAVAESRRVVVRGNTVTDDELQFRDLDRADASLDGVVVTGNTMTRSAVTTSLGRWDEKSGEAKGIVIEHNVWRGPVRYEWAGEVIEGLDAVRARLGFEADSVVEGGSDAAGR
ncbi:MAG: right-handed parallel beta-helix repeat-containing protein [Planctomycetota bacterium]